MSFSTFQLENSIAKTRPAATRAVGRACLLALHLKEVPLLRPLPFDRRAIRRPAQSRARLTSGSAGDGANGPTGHSSWMGGPRKWERANVSTRHMNMTARGALKWGLSDDLRLPSKTMSSLAHAGFLANRRKARAAKQSGTLAGAVTNDARDINNNGRRQHARLPDH